MVTLDKIYTKSGDKGNTRLATGKPIEKWHIRVQAYGTVDEVNAVLGIATLHSEGALREAINRIQNDLFDLGADLATPDEGKDLGYEPLRINSNQVERLESEIDKMNTDIPPLNSFVLPGGSRLSSYFHLARTVSRRAERLIAELSTMENEKINEHALIYANRLSDWLFVASRAANDNGSSDVKWIPGANR